MTSDQKVDNPLASLKENLQKLTPDEANKCLKIRLAIL